MKRLLSAIFATTLLSTTALAQRMRDRIREGGAIPFARFMEEALYGEGGYYARPELPIGEEGDFVTGSTHSPLFGRATARLLRSLDDSSAGTADYLEAGFGGGIHLAEVAARAGGRVLGWDRIERPVPKGAERLGDPGELGDRSIDGLIFSYELFDALPVHRLVGRRQGLRELFVGLTPDGGFDWREGDLSDPRLAELPGAELEEGQIADLAPGWRPLYRELARLLGRGLLVTCDYGFEAERLLDPRIRKHGTLACYRDQHVHRNPLLEPGSQDLTAHVDFSALIEEGEAAGLTTVALTRQAPWLAACGTLDEISDRPADERIQAIQLMDLSGMGEEIRVLVQSRDLDPSTVPALARLTDSRRGGPR